MDEQDVMDGLGVVALGSVLVAVVWLVVSPGHGGSRAQDQVRVSDQQVAVPGTTAGTPSRSVRQGIREHRHRCLDASVARHVPGCVIAALERAAPRTRSDQRAHHAKHSRAVAVARTTTRHDRHSAQTGAQHPAGPPSTHHLGPHHPTRPTARRPPPHHGPVPGGNTRPPRHGPRP